jgi:cell division protein FtsA
MGDYTAGLQINATHCAVTMFNSESLKTLRDATFIDIRPEEPAARFDVFDRRTAETVGARLREFERMRRRRVSRILYCLPSDKITRIEGYSQMVLHPRGTRRVRAIHVRKAIEQARLLSLDWFYRPIHMFPIEFRLDGKVFHTPPLGVFGRKLETRVAFYVVDKDYSANLDQFFEHMGRVCQRMILSPLAQMAACKTERLKKDNFILFDFGATRTEIAVFRRGNLIDCRVLPGGGDDADEALSKELGISRELAEDLKKNYGSVQESDLRDGRSITVKRQALYRDVQRGQINRCLHAFYSGRLKAIRGCLEELDALRHMEGAVCIGDAAQLNGLHDLLRQTVGLEVLPATAVMDVPGGSPASFLGSYGIFRFSDSRYNFENTYRFSNKLWTRIKNIWEEYF